MSTSTVHLATPGTERTHCHLSLDTVGFAGDDFADLTAYDYRHGEGPRAEEVSCVPCLLAATPRVAAAWVCPSMECEDPTRLHVVSEFVACQYLYEVMRDGYDYEPITWGRSDGSGVEYLAYEAARSVGATL